MTMNCNVVTIDCFQKDFATNFKKITFLGMKIDCNAVIIDCHYISF